jgi:hypothetical protein
MAAENTEIDQNLEEVTIENNTTEEQVAVEELTGGRAISKGLGGKDKFLAIVC